jgi:hypothetical protein
MKKLIDTDLEAFFKVCIFMPISFRDIISAIWCLSVQGTTLIYVGVVQGQGFPERQISRGLHSESAESE